MADVPRSAPRPARGAINRVVSFQNDSGEDDEGIAPRAARSSTGRVSRTTPLLGGSGGHPSTSATPSSSSRLPRSEQWKLREVEPARRHRDTRTVAPSVDDDEGVAHSLPRHPPPPPPRPGKGPIGPPPPLPPSRNSPSTLHGGPPPLRGPPRPPPRARAAFEDEPPPGPAHTKAAGSSGTPASGRPPPPPALVAGGAAEPEEGFRAPGLTPPPPPPPSRSAPESASAASAFSLNAFTNAGTEEEDGFWARLAKNARGALGLVSDIVSSINYETDSEQEDDTKEKKPTGSSSDSLAAPSASAESAPHAKQSGFPAPPLPEAGRYDNSFRAGEMQEATQPERGQVALDEADDQFVEYVTAFCVYLGVDVAAEPHLIQEVAAYLKQPLPEGWSALQTDKDCEFGAGFTYYMHPATALTQWTRPDEEDFLRVLAGKMKRRPLAGSRLFFSTLREQTRKARVAALEAQVGHLPDVRPLLRAVPEGGTIDDRLQPVPGPGGVIHVALYEQFPVLHAAALEAFSAYFGLGSLLRFGTAELRQLWIMKVAALCPVPQGWEFRFDEVTTAAVFVDSVAGTACRRHPLDAFFAGLLERTMLRHRSWEAMEAQRTGKSITIGDQIAFLMDAVQGDPYWLRFDKGGPLKGYVSSAVPRQAPPTMGGGHHLPTPATPVGSAPFTPPSRTAAAGAAGVQGPAWQSKAPPPSAPQRAPSPQPPPLPPKPAFLAPPGPSSLPADGHGSAAAASDLRLAAHAWKPPKRAVEAEGEDDEEEEEEEEDGEEDESNSADDNESLVSFSTSTLTTVTVTTGRTELSARRHGAAETVAAEAAAAAFEKKELAPSAPSAALPLESLAAAPQAHAASATLAAPPALAPTETTASTTSASAPAASAAPALVVHAVPDEASAATAATRAAPDERSTATSAPEALVVQAGSTGLALAADADPDELLAASSAPAVQTAPAAVRAVPDGITGAVSGGTSAASAELAASREGAPVSKVGQAVGSRGLSPAPPPPASLPGGAGHGRAAGSSGSSPAPPPLASPQAGSRGSSPAPPPPASLPAGSRGASPAPPPPASLPAGRAAGSRGSSPAPPPPASLPAARAAGSRGSSPAPPPPAEPPAALPVLPSKHPASTAPASGLQWEVQNGKWQLHGAAARKGDDDGPGRGERALPASAPPPLGKKSLSPAGRFQRDSPTGANASSPVDDSGEQTVVLNALADRLRATPHEDVGAIVAVLEALEAIPVSVHQLRTTQLGVLTQAFKDHPDKRLRTVARRLRRSWKDVVQAASVAADGADGGAAEAVDAEATPTAAARFETDAGHGMAPPAPGVQGGPGVGGLALRGTPALGKPSSPAGKRRRAELTANLQWLCRLFLETREQLFALHEGQPTHAIVCPGLREELDVVQFKRLLEEALMCPAGRPPPRALVRMLRALARRALHVRRCQEYGQQMHERFAAACAGHSDSRGFVTGAVPRVLQLITRIVEKDRRGAEEGTACDVADASGVEVAADLWVDSDPEDEGQAQVSWGADSGCHSQDEAEDLPAGNAWSVPLGPSSNEQLDQDQGGGAALRGGKPSPAQAAFATVPAAIPQSLPAQPLPHMDSRTPTQAAWATEPNVSEPLAPEAPRRVPARPPYLSGDLPLLTKVAKAPLSNLDGLVDCLVPGADLTTEGLLFQLADDELISMAYMLEQITEAASKRLVRELEVRDELRSTCLHRREYLQLLDSLHG